MKIEARLVFRISSRRFSVVALLLVLLAVGARAQSALDGFTPASMAPGVPTGYYALSGFDNINLYNGNLNFSLPLLKIGGRGDARYMMMLPIEQHWHSNNGSRIQQPSGDVIEYSGPDPNWWDPKPGYGPGIVLSRFAADFPNDCAPNTGGPYFTTTLIRLTFIEPNGTEHELVDQQTHGMPHTFSGCSYQTFPRGTVFISDDASGITFISDPTLPLGDDNKTPGGAVKGVTGNLMFPNGTLYRVEGGAVSYIRDRNGNLVRFDYETDPTTLYPRVISVIDSLDRSVTVAYTNSTTPYDQITYSGFGGVQHIIKVWRGSLGSALRSGSLATYAQLFPEISTDTSTYNPSDVISSVDLPNGKSYRFRYNQYAELARVLLPAGAAIEYDHTQGSGVVCLVPGSFSSCQLGSTILRRTIARRTYPDGVTLEGQTTYSPDTSTGSEVVTVDQLNPQGTVLLERSKHYFFGTPPIGSISPVGYSPWTESREYRSESIDTDNCTPSTCATMLRRVEETWGQPAAGTTWPLTQAETSDGAKPNDPEITQTTMTLSDTNQVSRRTFSYDKYLNRTDSYDYNFGAGAPGELLRRVHTDYLTVNPVNGLNYTATGVHIRDLQTQEWVASDTAGASKVSLTTYGYDQYGLDNCLNITEHDAGFPASFLARGNLTSVTRYANAATGTGAVITASAYNIAGNVVSATDAKGNSSTIDYGDSFCNGSTCGPALYKPNTYAFPTLTKTPKPDPSGTYGSAAEFTASAVYDYFTGHTYSTTDANGQIMRVEYEDQPGQLDRPKAVVRPDGGRTDFYYNDTAGDIYVRVLSDLDAGRRTETRQYLDGFGRVYRMATYENSVQATPWLNVDTRYDTLGRPAVASMPYRSAGGGTPLTDTELSNVKRSESKYDALGRVLKVTTMPYGAFVTIGYRGQRVFVTDQAGKQRISRSDALGRVVDVWEVTPNDPPNYPGIDSDSFPDPSGSVVSVYGYRTDYSYDALGNLRRVQQDGQARFFAYDSLSRLVRAKNPEQGNFTPDLAGGDFPALTDETSGVSNSQWSAGYLYDANGNLSKRKDARNITATYGYDNINRNTTVDYSDSTPDVSRYYDGATLGKGRPWKSESFHNVMTTIDEYDTAGRPTRETHQFWVNVPQPGWGQSYTTMLGYNLAGGVVFENYPSQHKVEYQYDAAGRLGDNGQLPAFKGTLGDNVERTYASQIVYDELGGMNQERFGTDTPVYNKHIYNSRGQLAEIRVSTYAYTETDPNLKMDWNRGAIINHYSTAPGAWGATGGGPDNNGNLKKQDVYVPANGQDTPSSNNLTQSYGYDALNRLTSVEEKLEDGSPSLSQVYFYDRFGNRTITTGGTSNASATQFDVRELSATNRLYAPGDLDYADSNDARRRMRYDAAGNLTYDSYTGAGTRAYDAEGRMTWAQTGGSQSAVYGYDAEGKRVKRNDGATEVWQIYGLDGELLAEYGAGASPASPQKEYGYRGGELLVTAAAAATGWGPTPILHDNPLVARQTVVQSRHITELRDAINALRVHMGMAAYTWLTNASSGASITADPIIELRQALDHALGAPSPAYAAGLVQHQPILAVHIQELRDRVLAAWQTGGSGTDVRWLVTDQLGTPRMILDKTGTLSGLTRHDYLPFGEDAVGSGWRLSSRGYAGDALRQKFTGYERDSETGLDYAQARYFSSVQGRFTSPDPMISSGRILRPQTWNRYAFALNNPLRFVDPSGLQQQDNQKPDKKPNPQSTDPNPDDDQDEIVTIITTIAHWVKNQVEPTAHAQEDDPAEEEESEGVREEREWEEGTGRNPLDEPPAKPPLMILPITENYLREGLGVDPSALPTEPDPEPFIGPLLDSTHRTPTDLILAAGLNQKFIPFRGKQGLQSSMTGDANAIFESIATQNRAAVNTASNGSRFFTLRNGTEVRLYTSGHQSYDHPPTILISTPQGGSFTIRIRP